jgi:ABC-type phosphate transport system auxiliary subunit
MNLKLIVLANYSGARVAALSFSEAAKALANGELVPLLLQSDLAEKVAELSRFLRTQISSITQQLEIKQKAARRRQLLARLEQSRRERLEIKKARREAEKRARQLEQQRLRQRQIRELEQSLQNLGAGSSFVHHERQDLIMQFALRLKHSGKLVFVDKKGVRVGEWLPHELAELMVDGKVELLASRQSNEQTLEQIVAQQRSRRKDMGVNV